MPSVSKNVPPQQSPPEKIGKKVGIIYNDVKPVACQVSQELTIKLEAHGCQVETATGLGGLLGYANVERQTRLTPIESLVPAAFDDAKIGRAHV